ncbi:hypothetical protein ACHAW6_008042 [Cyclotella cf. meneghiniana]
MTDDRPDEVKTRQKSIIISSKKSPLLRAASVLQKVLAMLPASLIANLLFVAPHVLLPSRPLSGRANHARHTADFHRRPTSCSLFSLSESSIQSANSGSVSSSSIHRFHKFRTSVYHAPQIEKILLLSDLHCDYAANRNWLENICNSQANSPSRTMILVAGDVSHNLSILQWTFRTLKKSFDEVAFVPGNHDLWLDKPRKHKSIATKLDSDDNPASISGLITTGLGDGCMDSIEKLEKIFQLCIDENVRIGPVKVGSDYNQSVLWVVPLLSWYHSSFDTEPPIECWGGIPLATKVVADYRKASWPEPLSPFDDSVAQFMDQLNDVIFDWDSIANIDGVLDDSMSILTFSHFLPRIELLPEKRYLSLPTLHSCVGSTFLEERLRTFQSKVNVQRKYSQQTSGHLHAFGHSHLSWDQCINGVRYVHVPLAYPREWEQRRRSLEIGTMKGDDRDRRFPVCIWKKTSQAKQGGGFPKEWLGGWWSKYYDIIPRQPHRIRELAPWAAKRFRKLPGGSIENFDHMKVEIEIKLHDTKPG